MYSKTVKEQGSVTEYWTISPTTVRVREKYHKAVVPKFLNPRAHFLKTYSVGTHLSLQNKKEKVTSCSNLSFYLFFTIMGMRNSLSEHLWSYKLIKLGLFWWPCIPIYLAFNEPRLKHESICMCSSVSLFIRLSTFSLLCICRVSVSRPTTQSGHNPRNVGTVWVERYK